MLRVRFLVVVAICFVLPLPMASAISLEEVEASFTANVSKIHSGSVTYSVEYFNPRDNILGAPGYQIDVPVLEGEDDVALPGIGTFKWKGGKFRAELRRASLGTIPDILLQTRVWNCLLAWNGSVHRQISSFYKSPYDALKEEVDLSNPGLLEDEHGQIRGKPKYHSALVFLGVGCFCSTLRETPLSILSRYETATVREDGLVVLEQTRGRGMRFTCVVDPKTSYMPVKLQAGAPEEGIIREDRYENRDAVWFPQSSVTSHVSEGKLRYRITCRILTAEFGADYPDSDFEIEFPVGMQVDDQINERDFVVGSE